MSYPEHFKQLHGLPVFTLPAPDTPEADKLPDPGAVAWRLDCYYGQRWGKVRDEYEVIWQRFLDSVDTERVTALVIGPWFTDGNDAMGPVVQLLCEAKDRFPALRALFLADIVSEECEISWLMLGDVTPVLTSFPQLEHLGVRGGGSYESSLELRQVRHEALRVLRFESGGLPAGVVQAVAASELPALENLELWLGVDEYGGDATLADLAPILSGDRFPALRHLGLQDSEIQDEIATAVASAPVVARLASLNLSMGTLSDAGAEALLTGQPLTHLTRLDLSHHFLSDAMMQRVKDALEPAGVTVDLSEQEEAEEWDEDEVHRFVAVSE